jgi:predicted TIM-barrel fold metal-dependent hydrolase
VQLEDVAMAHPNLIIVIAHMGHPWVEDTVVLIRKQPNIYSDVSALYYRPWQYYNALMLAQEYGCAHKLLFGTDYPFTTATDSVNGLKNINHIIGTSGLPPITEKTISGILERDTLKLLNLS